MKLTFFPGNRGLGAPERRSSGAALPAVLGLIIVFSLILNSFYYALRARYVQAKKQAAACYAEIDAYNRAFASRAPGEEP